MVESRSDYMFWFSDNEKKKGGCFASSLSTQAILMRPHWTDSLKEVSLVLYEVQGETTDFMQN